MSTQMGNPGALYRAARIGGRCHTAFSAVTQRIAFLTTHIKSDAGETK